MKLEVACNGETQQLEIDIVSGDEFRIRIRRSGEERLVKARIISRSGERWTLEVNGRIEDLLISENGDGVSVDWENRTFNLKVYGLRDRILQKRSRPQPDGIVALKAQMPGKVVKVLKKSDDPVEEGQGLAIIESMKMQNELKSPKSGTVVTCCVEPGATVNAGDLLFEVE